VAWCVAVSQTHCNTLHHTATHCNTLQHTTSRSALHALVPCVAVSQTHKHTATLRNTLQHTATHCNTLQHIQCTCCARRCITTHCDTLQHAAAHKITECTPFTCSACTSARSLNHTATHCNTLQHTATHCNTLQHTATHSAHLFSVRWCPQMYEPRILCTNFFCTGAEDAPAPALQVHADARTSKSYIHIYM